MVMLANQWEGAIASRIAFGIVRTVALDSIDLYQTHISPRKGFDCPHRILYGTQSCSNYVKHLLTQQSLQSAVKLSIQRFQACDRASQILKTQKTIAGFRCIVIPCCIPL
jgi:putative component of membrane protein insertase Oxa1/YidC/SpoIIIJ protein YidD